MLPWTRSGPDVALATLCCSRLLAQFAKKVERARMPGLYVSPTTQSKCRFGPRLERAPPDTTVAVLACAVSGYAWQSDARGTSAMADNSVGSAVSRLRRPGADDGGPSVKVVGLGMFHRGGHAASG